MSFGNSDHPFTVGYRVRCSDVVPSGSVSKGQTAVARVAKITDSRIRAGNAQRAENRLAELWLWDEELPGFGVRIAPTAATFVVKYALGGRGGRQTRISSKRCAQGTNTQLHIEWQPSYSRKPRGVRKYPKELRNGESPAGNGAAL
jgi:hypothetical protein